MIQLLRFVGFSALLVSIGCTNNPVTTNNQNDPNLPFATAKSVSVTRETVPVSDLLLNELVKSNNKFAVNMYMKLVEDGGNTFFSPYSIMSAFGMTSAGAVGETDKQIRKALSVTLQGDDFHAAVNMLDQSLMNYVKSVDGIKLNVINTVWGQSGWEFKTSYLDKISRYYGAGINILDFISNPENSREIINTWVADQTSQKIKDLIPSGNITNQTRLVLTNAIYFMSDWQTQFDSKQTVAKPFYLLDNTTIQANRMVMGGPAGGTKETGPLEYKPKFLYAYKNGIRAIELPYKNDRFVMTLFLPDSGTFPLFESSLSEAVINDLVESLDTTVLTTVVLPKFTIHTKSIELKKKLITLGMVLPFSGADFSGIDYSASLFIGNVFHKAFIAVDEKGTEAAAATAIIQSFGLCLGCTSEQTPKFVADRPFIYAIRDKQTKAILFMGRVLNPNLTE